jgi:hypothetical protein
MAYIVCHTNTERIAADQTNCRKKVLDCFLFHLLVLILKAKELCLKSSNYYYRINAFTFSEDKMKPSSRQILTNKTVVFLCRTRHIQIIIIIIITIITILPSCIFGTFQSHSLHVQLNCDNKASLKFCVVKTASMDALSVETTVRYVNYQICHSFL